MELESDNLEEKKRGQHRDELRKIFFWNDGTRTFVVSIKVLSYSYTVYFVTEVHQRN